jgi:hypothetical protein
MPKAVKKVEMSDSEDEPQVVDNHQTDDNNTDDEQPTKPKINKKVQMFEDLKNINNKINELEEELRKLFKEQTHIINKLAKSSGKQRQDNPNKEPSGINKPNVVPKCIREYLSLGDDELKSRPELVKLLKEKFEEKGFINSETKLITLDKATLKKFGLPKDYEPFKGNKYASFLKVLYDNEKETVNV